MTSPRIDFSPLSPEERLELIGELWDSLDESEIAPLSPEQLAELERRARDAEANPKAGRSWPEVRADLLKKLE